MGRCDLQSQVEKSEHNFQGNRSRINHLSVFEMTRSKFRVPRGAEDAGWCNDGQLFQVHVGDRPLFFYPYSLKSLIFDMTLDFFALYEMSLSGGSGVDERTRIWRKAFVETGGLMLERLFVGIAEV